MGRVVRKVPADWQHPRDERGSFVPLYGKFPYIDEEVEEGIRDGWLTEGEPNYGLSLMPQWSEEEKTHYQMYEGTSEGTPISPVMDSPENLAAWLVENEASVFADITASYEEWLCLCRGGWGIFFIEGKSQRIDFFNPEPPQSAAAE